VLYLARARAKLGQLVAARDLYLRLKAEPLRPDMPAAFRTAKAEGAAELAALDPRLPRIRIVLRAAPAGKTPLVRVDAAAVDADALAEPVAVDPGEHTVAAAIDGSVVVKRRVSVAEGAAVREVVLDLGSAGPREPATTEPEGPKPEPPAEQGSLAPALAAFSVGAVGLGVGVATGVLSLAKVHDLKSVCPTNPCSPTYAGLADTARTLGNASTAGFVIGGAGVAAGVVLLVVRRSAAPPAPAPTVTVGPGSLLVAGRF
jgi:hypothetical protein